MTAQPDIRRICSTLLVGFVILYTSAFLWRLVFNQSLPPSLPAPIQVPGEEQRGPAPSEQMQPEQRNLPRLRGAPKNQGAPTASRLPQACLDQKLRH